MKKFIRSVCFSLVFFIILTSVISAGESGGIITSSPVFNSAPSVSAECAVLIDADSGDVLYEKNYLRKHGMASTTKIMTAIVALESLGIEETVLITDQSVGIEGSSIYLCKDEKLTLEELLYALLLESANDAACAIAIAVGGSVESFVEMMNKKAKELNLTNTHFANPHGLYDEDHYSSAYDLAVLLSYCMQNEDFAKLTSTKKIALKGSNSSYSRLLVNHNKLLSDEGIIGGKTGFTKKTGRCLVSCSELNGIRLVAVTLNAPSDWEDHRSLYAYGYKLYKNVTYEKAGPLSQTIHICGGNEEEVNIEIASDATFTVRDGIKVERVLKLKRFYYAPVQKGQIVGYLCYYNASKLIFEIPITASEESEKLEVEKGFFEKLFD